MTRDVGRRNGIQGAMLVVILVACGLLLAGYITSKSSERREQITLASSTYDLEVVTDENSQQKGLSGRAGLARGTGMLFAYENEGQRCIWMKDMHFSIDILWINASKRLTRVESNIRPESYPEQYCARAKNVLELKAGEAIKNDLKIGDKAEF